MLIKKYREMSRIERKYFKQECKIVVMGLIFTLVLSLYIGLKEDTVVVSEDCNTKKIIDLELSDFTYSELETIKRIIQSKLD